MSEEEVENLHLERQPCPTNGFKELCTLQSVGVSEYLLESGIPRLPNMLLV